MEAISIWIQRIRSKSGDKFFALADNALGSLMRFASGILVARLGGAGDFADYVLCSTALFLITGLTSSYIETPMLNLAPGVSPADRNKIIRWTQRRSIKAALVLSSTGFAAMLGLDLAQADFPVLPALVAAIAFAIIAQFHRARLLATFQTRIAFFADLTIPVFTIGFAIAFWRAGASANEGYWCGFSAGSLTASLIMVFGRRIPLASAPREKHMLRATESGKMMLIGSAANSSCSRMHPFILKSIAGASALAQYGAAWTFLGPIRLVASGYVSLLRPRLSQLDGQADHQRASKLIRRSQFAIAGAGTALSVFLYIAGPDLGLFIFGPSLPLSSGLLLITATYATLDAMTSLQMVNLQISQTDGPRLAMRLRVFSACVSIALVLPGSVYFGAIGAIGSLLVSEAMYFVLASVFQKTPPDRIASTRGDRSAFGFGRVQSRI